MKKGEWTFLSNHGRLLVYIAKHPQTTAQVIAQEANLSIRAVQNIIADLENSGYITRNREGRCNHYTINPERPLRHRLERDYIIGDVLEVLGYNGHRDKIPIHI